MQDDMETLNTTMTEQKVLVTQLSGDIGDMADRIVATEVLLADSLAIVVANPDFAGTSSNNGVFLTEPMDGDNLTGIPNIVFNPSSTVYLIYASTTPTFSAGNTISLYVDTTTALSTKWSLHLLVYLYQEQLLRDCLQITVS